MTYKMCSYEHMIPTSPATPSMTYRIRHCPEQNEWNITRENEACIGNVPGSEARGMADLTGAISWCYRAAAGRSSLVIVDHGDRQHRLRLHSEPDDAVNPTN